VGRNVTMEPREGGVERLPALAADLVRRQVTVIVAAGINATQAAKAATQTIPVVFGMVGDPIILLAGRYAVPTLFFTRDEVISGGLASYGTLPSDLLRQVGVYTGRILKGEKPADLPIVQLDKFQLVINLATAKALGLTIPETLLATADEVIQ
jgi:ABC-type uncharacterized transport system substrate-binding protein